jgi:hypothetical protein
VLDLAQPLQDAIDVKLPVHGVGHRPAEVQIVKPAAFDGIHKRPPGLGVTGAAEVEGKETVVQCLAEIVDGELIPFFFPLQELKISPPHRKHVGLAGAKLQQRGVL